MKTPVIWFGGKVNLSVKIIALFPEHHTYCEPFGGGGAVLFAKAPSPVEVYNDLDSGLVNFFRVLRDKEQAEELKRLLDLTPYSREEYNACREQWEGYSDPVQRAWAWYVVARMSFGGEFGNSWSSTTALSRRGGAFVVTRFALNVATLSEATKRIRHVQIEHKDGLECIQQYDTPETLFYLDPPYTHSERRSGKYAHEMTDEQHSALVDVLLNIEGKAILSGYDSPLYAPLDDAGWWRQSVEVSATSAGRTKGSGLQGAGSCAHQRRTEVLWISPNVEVIRQVEMF